MDNPRLQLPGTKSECSLEKFLTYVGACAYAAGFKRGYRAAKAGDVEPTTEEIKRRFHAERETCPLR